MAIAVICEAPGMTREIYDQVYRAMHREGPPDGGLFHVAGPTQQGWRVVEVWESQDAFDAYARTTLQPLLRRQGAASRGGACHAAGATWRSMCVTRVATGVTSARRGGGAAPMGRERQVNQ